MSSKRLRSNRGLHIKQVSSKNLLSEAPVTRDFQAQLWTPIIAETMGVNLDLITGYSGDDEESKLIKMIKDTKKHPDHAIMEELAEHIKTEKMEMQNQEAKKKVNSLVTYVNLRDSTGSTALHYACQQRFETAQDICEFLLDRGARIGVVAGRLGITPLHLAIKSKNIPLAMFLLERGAPIDTKTLSFDSEDDLKDIMGRTGNVGKSGVSQGKSIGGGTLSYEVHCEDVKALEANDEISFVKMEESERKNQQREKSRRESGMITTMSQASLGEEDGGKKRITFTIKAVDYKTKLITIDGKMGYEASLLKEMMNEDEVNIRKWVWIRKPQKNKNNVTSQFAKHSRWKGHFDESAIHMATRNCLIPVVRELLDSGANPNEKNYQGETPLHIAFRKNKEYKAVYLAARRKRLEEDATPEDRINWEHIKVKAYEEENPCSIIAFMLINAGGDIQRMDNDSNKAMSDLDVEYWYESHKHKLCSLLGNPTVKGYDDPIFNDKRTQYAIDFQWQKKRTKYVFDIVMWIIYMFLLFYPGMNTNRRHFYDKRWSDIKWATNELFVNEEFRDGMALNYNDIANVEEFYEWFDNVALPGLYGEALPYRVQNTTSKGMRGAVSTFGRIVGRPRIRQLRSNLKGRCSGIYGGKNSKNNGQCMYPYITKSDDEFYNKLTKEDKQNEIVSKRSSLAWDDLYCDGIGIIKGERHCSRPDKGNNCKEKTEDYYSILFDGMEIQSGGFSPELPDPRLGKSGVQAKAISQKLQKCNFIDANTRVVVVEFVLVNPSMLDIFTLAHFAVEFDVTGAVYPRSKIHQYRIFRDPSKIGKRHGVTQDIASLYMYYVLIFMTICYLYNEFDQFTTSVYNAEYMHLWPRVRLPGFVLLDDADADSKALALSDYLREKLYRKDENVHSMSKRKPSFSIPISLRFAAAVAKTATEDIPDQDAVQIHIRWPWKGTKSDEVNLFPADRYITFMERLSSVI